MNHTPGMGIAAHVLYQLNKYGPEDPDLDLLPGWIARDYTASQILEALIICSEVSYFDEMIRCLAQEVFIQARIIRDEHEDEEHALARELLG